MTDGLGTHSDDTKREEVLSPTLRTYSPRTAGSKKYNKCRHCGQIWERTSSANHRPGCPNTDKER